MNEENIHLRKLNELVADAVKEEELISENLANPAEDMITRGDKLADKVASFGGSWKFIITFGVILFVWIVANSVFLASKAFDPYPFILLNLILSCIAAIQAPVIMMSQNRKEEKDRKRSENDYLINLKSEIEIRNLHQKLDMLIAEEMANLFKIQKLQLDEIDKLHKKLDQHLSSTK